MADPAENLVFPRKLIKNFLLLYKELRCLWDRKSLHYKHKQKRSEAIGKLTEIVQQYYRTATRVHVLRKIESLRACARREYKRVVSSRLQTSNPDEYYNPQLWYYDLISFIFEEVPNTQTVEIKQPMPDLDIEDDDTASLGEVNTSEEQMNYSDYGISDSMVEVTNNISMPRSFSYEDEHNKSNKRQCTEIQDEYDAIGINVAAKLRTLPANMRIIAEKLINDVLFQAQINGLNSSTVLTTSDPFKSE